MPLPAATSNTAAQPGRPLETAASCTPRRLFCCRVGGASQAEAERVAAELAADAGMRLVDISADDLRSRRGWPEMPRAAFLERFGTRPRGAFARAPPSQPAVRAALSGTAPTGSDLFVVPAGVGENGAASPPAREVAAVLARARSCPVLRVRRKPAAMRGWLLLVAGAPGCGRLAAGLLRSDPWPSAAVSILPVADYRPRIRRMVEAQAELLRAHGRPVSVMRPVDLDFEGPELAARIGRFDAAVASGLSDRGVWPFGVVRACAQETVAGTVPLLLIP
ncbi:MAG: hypothetical protein ICV73_22045 [Acetobacteraceae bacterium]|nr:hypothetical protein [Acetobacteraceae bacterium]